MAKFLLILFVPLLTSWNCIAQSKIADEEYAVFTAVFRHYFKGEPQGSIAIERTTGSERIEGRSVRYLLDRSSKIDLFLIDDFNSKNKQEAELENRFGFSNQTYLLKEELREIFIPNLSESELLHEKDWEEFRKRYGNSGLFSLSRVGFDRKHKRALVTMGNMYGWLGGEGNYYILVRRGPKWKVKKKVMSWIS